MLFLACCTLWPLLNTLRIDMCGLQILHCVEAVKLSAYADDVVVLISNQNDVNLMLQTLEDFRNVSAKVNRQKSEAIIVGSWQTPLKEVKLFHIWLLNSGIAFLIMFGVQTHSLYLNLD